MEQTYFFREIHFLILRPIGEVIDSVRAPTRSSFIKTPEGIEKLYS